MPEQAAAYIASSLVAAGASTAVATAVAAASVAVITYVGSQLTADLLGGRDRARSPSEMRQAARQPRPPKRRGYGRAALAPSYVLYATIGADSIDVAALHDGRIDAIESWWLHEDPVTLGDLGGSLGDGWVVMVDGLSSPTGQSSRYSRAFVPLLEARVPTVQIHFRLGLPTETPYSDVVAMGLGWTSDHRGDNVASVRIRCNNVSSAQYLDVYPFYLPRPIALARLQWVYDWRDEAQDLDDPSTWAWSDNPALCIAHFRCLDPDGPGRPWATTIAPHLAAWTQAANDCDAGVPLAAGGTEPRYRLDLLYELDQPTKTTLARMLEACDGRLIPQADGGETLSVGVFRQGPLIALDHVLAVETRRYRPTEERANTVRGAYLSAARNWTEAPYVDWVDAAALADAGVEQVLQRDFVAVRSHSQVRRLAKRALLKENAELRGSAVLALAGRAAVRGRWARLPLPDLGLGATDIEIIGDPVIDLASGTVSFDWLAIGAAIDAWDAATEEGAPPTATAPDGGVIEFTEPVLDEVFWGFGGTSYQFAQVRVLDPFPGLTFDSRPEHDYVLRFVPVSAGGVVEAVVSASSYYDALAARGLAPDNAFSPYVYADGRIAGASNAGRVGVAYWSSGIVAAVTYDVTVALRIGGVVVFTSSPMRLRVNDGSKPAAEPPNFTATASGATVTLSARVPRGEENPTGVEFRRVAAGGVFADSVSVATVSGAETTGPGTGIVTTTDTPGDGAWLYFARGVNGAGAGPESSPRAVTLTAGLDAVTSALGPPPSGDWSTTFTPAERATLAAWFAATPPLVMIRPNVAADLKQEITGASATTAVAAAGHPIGSARNAGSAGGWYVAPSDARPTLESSGGVRAIAPDGVGDWLVSSALHDLGATWSHVGAWRSDTVGRALFATAADIYSGPWHRSTGTIGWDSAAGGYEDLAATIVSGAFVLTIERVGSSLSGRINGAGGAAITPHDHSAATQGLALFSRRNDSASSPLDGALYWGLWTAATLPTGVRGLLERAVARLAGGVTLA